MRGDLEMVQCRMMQLQAKMRGKHCLIREGCRSQHLPNLEAVVLGEDMKRIDMKGGGDPDDRPEVAAVLVLRGAHAGKLGREEKAV